MTGAIILLVFLLVLAFGVAGILYVSKGDVTTRNFNLMAGWALGIYFVIAFITLLMLSDVLPATVG